MKKIIVMIGIAAIITGVVVICVNCNQNKKIESSKIKIVTTLFPLYDMAKTIGAEKADVSMLLPPGVEPHSFEPKPTDIVRINEADIFVYTGKLMEPWAEDIIKGITNKKLIVVDASKGTQMIPAVFHDEDEPAGSLDPHIWLDFDNAKIMARSIAQALETRDPANKAFFKQKTDDYNRRLSGLDAAFRKTLRACKTKEVIYGGHYAFGYVAKRYGLRCLAAQGVSPDAEPTAKDLARLVEQIKKNNIKYVFYEELTSSKIAETIARETNAKLLLLNAAHNVTKDQFQRGVSFFDILHADLENLKIGLECQ
jgi:zinc transport system substrate-binding protein